MQHRLWFPSPLILFFHGVKGVKLYMCAQLNLNKAIHLQYKLTFYLIFPSN